MRYDVFISHASEDKEAVARPLAQELSDRGVSVWLDEFELVLGDSLRRTIDAGLRESRFGVVILSPAFFSKEWPQRELDALAARTDLASRAILPIWHDVYHQDVLQFSPLLADRVAISTANGLSKVAEAIVQAVRREKQETPKSPRPRRPVRSNATRWFSLEPSQYRLDIQSTRGVLKVRADEEPQSYRTIFYNLFDDRRYRKLEKMAKEGGLFQTTLEIGAILRISPFAIFFKEINYLLEWELEPLEAIPLARDRIFDLHPHFWRITGWGKIGEPHIGTLPPPDKDIDKSLGNLTVTTFAKSKLLRENSVIRVRVTVHFDEYAPLTRRLGNSTTIRKERAWDAR